ncbi:MAG: aminotransferase class I/II-fold pyridoxal phosphate-dependent enzyme [Planctomycetota bacterium]
MTPQTGAYSVDTLCPRAGTGTADGEPLVPPLVQSTTFVRDGLESRAVHCYSRESNPTVAALETALGRLEDAPPAVAFGTGLAAEAGLFQTLLSSGDHVVCSRAVYGGTTRLLQQVLSRGGIRSTFVDSRDGEALAAAIEPSTKLVFLETPANPTLDLTDLARAADIAHAAGALVAVDNTFLTAALQRPIELGADFSVYSTTKFVEGHSVALGGAVVGRDEALLDELRFVRKCTGGIQAPFNAWLTLQGLKTLPLRLRRQSESAARIADELARIPDVCDVFYPTRLDAELAERQHLGAHGAVLSFELEGGGAQARELLRHVRLCTLVEHVGSVETLLTHSASMTHGGVAPAERAAAGVTEGLLRLSVGLEDPADVLADLRQAIEASAQGAPSREEVAACPAQA